MTTLRDHARTIWQAAVEAADPARLVCAALADPGLPLAAALAGARRVIVVGAGKAGATMSAAVEESLADRLDLVEGWVNVPAGSARSLQRIHLHPARPDGSNQPTAEGVAGADRILELVRGSGPDDVVLCLLSGGGSALLPAPVEGVTLADKQAVTRLLHACGATINEMNAVRKHLSRIKGGRLAEASRARALFSLIVSDVVGDPLDVIASGPTAADPTTFAEALAVLTRYHLLDQAPAAVLAHLRAGAAGTIPETPKQLPGSIHNHILASNARALTAAQSKAEELGYRVLNLGPCIEGETRPVATAFAGIARAMRDLGVPLTPPACLLSGGETTVTLGDNHGLGGRNQEFVLAAALHLGRAGLRDLVILSGGTDGEDGPTDAAGACADERTLAEAERLGLDAADFLTRHDTYPFFDQTGDLLRTGLTGTNVMDVRVILLAARGA
jgi:hydroxypyruvate reductase/glycerate 2-kinase